jgi:gliding motility-associated-like protein
MEVIVVSDTPGSPSLILETSKSVSGGYNINCYGEKTGSIIATVFNSDGIRLDNVDYYWPDAPDLNTSTRTNLAAGVYTLTVTDNITHLTATSSVTLTQPGPIMIQETVIKPFCKEKPEGMIIIDLSGGDDTGIYTYKWFDNSTSSYASDLLPGNYTVEVTDANRCKVVKTIELTAERDLCLIMPEAFSPNGDAINDYWEIMNIDLYPTADITIYNRWGQQIWKSDRGYTEPWRGNDSRGNELPLDSYHYAIDLHNGSKAIIGTVTILR